MYICMYIYIYILNGRNPSTETHSVDELCRSFGINSNSTP